MMKKIILYIPLFLVLNFISCSSEENIELEETETDNLNPEDPDNDEYVVKIIDVVGKWRLDYTIVKNTGNVGNTLSTNRIESTEYDYVEYEFKEDNTFVETIAEGESSDDVEVIIRKGNYKASIPERYSGKLLELRYDNNDVSNKRFDLINDGSRIKIDYRVVKNCGCSHPNYDHEEFYNLVR